jgi:hypothetical protein
MKEKMIMPLLCKKYWNFYIYEKENLISILFLYYFLYRPAQPPPEKPFVCLAPQCERRFAKKSHLKGHIHSWHKELLHPCNLCSKSFVAHRQLKRHRIKIHGQDQVAQVQNLLPGGQGQPVILPAATERLL